MILIQTGCSFNRYIFVFINIVMLSDNASHLYQNQTNSNPTPENPLQSTSSIIPSSYAYEMRTLNFRPILNQHTPSIRFNPYNLLSRSHALHLHRSYHQPSYIFSPFVFRNTSYNINYNNNFARIIHPPNPWQQNFKSSPYLTFRPSNLANESKRNFINQNLHVHSTAVIETNDRTESLSDNSTQSKTLKINIASSHEKYSSLEEINSNFPINLTKNASLPGSQASRSDLIVQNSYESQSINSNVECTAKSLKLNAAQNIPEIDTSNNSTMKEWNDLIFKAVKYVATADNSEFLPKIKVENINKMVIKYNSYFREFSMTRFRKQNKKIFLQLENMQKKYENILNSLMKSETWELSKQSVIFADIFSDQKEKHFKSKILLSTAEKKNFSDSIIRNINNIFQNFFTPQKTPISSEIFELQRLTFSVDELKHIFSQEKNNLKEGKTDIPEVLEICSYFVNYESKLFGDMDRIMIAESLEVLKITETFSRLKKCMETNIVYEILVFINLYEKNLVQVVKKHHVVSTVFLLNAICFCLDRIKSNRFLYTHYQKKYPNSRFLFSTEIFYVGQLFEKLLRNLEDHEMKADCYGLLNCCRYFLKVNSFRGVKKAMLILQMPDLIAMVVDEAFNFTKDQFKELASFILYTMKTKGLGCPEFYNDKFEYFFEQNLSFIDSIFNYIDSFINDHKESFRENLKLSESILKYKNIYENLSVGCGKKPTKNIQLKRLYIFQLYWIATFRYKCLAFYTNHDNFLLMVTNMFKKIEIYYE